MATTRVMTPRRETPGRRAQHAPATTDKRLGTTGPGLRAVVACSLGGALLLWLAQPPAAWTAVAWIAPLPWLYLAVIQRPLSKAGWWAVFAGGWLHWVLVLWGLTTAHWLNYFGLAALAAYLSATVLLWLVSSRYLIQIAGTPAWLMLPLTWAGMEMLRSLGPINVSVALLGHSQVAWLRLIQVADLFGAVTVSFLIVATGAAVIHLVQARASGAFRRTGPVGLAALLVVASLAYGSWRLRTTPDLPADREPLNVVMIQGSIDTEFGGGGDRVRRIWDEYLGLTARAVDRQLPDLLVWPESMFPPPAVELSAHSVESMGQISALIRASQDAQLFRESVQGLADFVHRESDRRETFLLLGTATHSWEDDPMQRFNSAILVNPEGAVAGSYHKMAPIIFGEYLPGGNWFPQIYNLAPMENGLSAGSSPRVFDVHGYRVAPSICFESTMPRLIHSQVRRLKQTGQSPDVLVNLTNDGWFWGSSILDLHFRCSIFRAIENRRPVVITANTGFSAWIDGNGDVQVRGPRRDRAVLRASVVPDGRSSPHQWWGEIPALGTLAVLLAGWVGCLVRRVRERRSPDNAS